MTKSLVHLGLTEVVWGRFVAKPLGLFAVM